MTYRKEVLAANLEDLRSLHTEMRELGLESQRFYVPRVLELDNLSRHMVCEWLPAFTPLAEVGELKELMVGLQEASSALATIHGRPAKFGRVISGALLGVHDLERVALHGDYSLKNIGHWHGHPHLAIIDWGHAHCAGAPLVCGSRYWDCAQLVKSIYEVARRLNCTDAFRDTVLAFTEWYDTISPTRLCLYTLAVSTRRVLIRRMVHRARVGALKSAAEIAVLTATLNAELMRLARCCGQSRG